MCHTHVKRKNYMFKYKNVKTTRLLLFVAFRLMHTQTHANHVFGLALDVSYKHLYQCFNLLLLCLSIIWT